MKARYLSIQVDNSLDWKEQIKTITSKVSSAIGFLKYAKNILPIASVKALYGGTVEPISDIAALYGAAVVQLPLISSKNFKTELQEF